MPVAALSDISVRWFSGSSNFFYFFPFRVGDNYMSFFIKLSGKDEGEYAGVWIGVDVYFIFRIDGSYRFLAALYQHCMVGGISTASIGSHIFYCINANGYSCNYARSHCSFAVTCAPYTACIGF